MRDRGRDYRIVFVPEPVCWTEVPSTRAVLRRQRHPLAPRACGRRCGPTGACCSARRYGRVGWVGLPYYWLFELFAPLIEAAGLVLVPLGVAFGVVNVQYAVVLLLVSYGYAIFVTLAAMCAEEWAFHRYERWRDLAAGVGGAVFENLGYRQMTVLVAARGLVGQPARQGAGVGRDDPRGVRGGGGMTSPEDPDHDAPALELERLRAAAEDKDQRLARLGHELRAPLTSIAGCVEMLLDGVLGDLTPEQCARVEVVGRNAERLQASSPSCRRPGRPACVPCTGTRACLDVAAIVGAAVDLLRPTARLGGVVLDERPAGRRLHVLGDALRLEGAVVNVVGNAVKYTPRGGSVTVRSARGGRPRRRRGGGHRDRYPVRRARPPDRALVPCAQRHGIRHRRRRAGPGPGP